tara:strand:+ start:241 stop:513 length:273 start_codon:yes stop_codon:yes gene_type:complete
MQTLLIFMSFLNFMFYPLVIATIVAVIIEQIFRRGDNETNIYLSMRIRKFLYNQAWIVNVLWFLGYFIVMFMVRGQAQPQMPDMIWDGTL